MPSLFIRLVLAGRVGGVETNAAPFPVDHESRRDDVPNALRDDVGCQEIEFSWLVRLARTVRLDPTDITTSRDPLDCRLDLYTYEVTGSLDCYVVARELSPRFGKPETQFGGFCHELKLGPLA